MPGKPAKISLLGFVSEYHCSREYVTWIVIRILCHCQTFPGFGDIGMVFWKILKKSMIKDQRVRPAEFDNARGLRMDSRRNYCAYGTKFISIVVGTKVRIDVLNE